MTEKEVFMGVPLSFSQRQKSEFQSHCQQFCQALIDNLNMCFEEAVDVAKLLDPKKFPEDEQKRVVYDDRQVHKLAKQLCMEPNTVVSEFRLWKAGMPKGIFRENLMLSSGYTRM